MNKCRVEDNFQVLQVLGKGAFSTVYKVIRYANNETYALKRVPFKNLKVKEVQNALNEIRILASVKHPNIVGYRESFIDTDTEDLCVVMNFAGGGDLSTKIKECRDKKIRLPENLVIKFFYQLTSALYELHIRNVIHRDLKTANIFLSHDLKNVILGDMNVSKIVKNEFAYTQTGTPYYASPEVWRDEPYSIKTDVWSLGCVIYEMCMLKPPFNATDMDGLFEKVQHCDYDKFDNFYSKQLRDSIMKLIAFNSENRPNCEKILNFSIFSNLKVLLGENSINQNVPDFFNFASNQLLETIKPGRDFRNLDALLPPAQYSFELNEGDQFLQKFANNSIQQKTAKTRIKKNEVNKSEKIEDVFLKNKICADNSELFVKKNEKKGKSSPKSSVLNQNQVFNENLKDVKIDEELLLKDKKVDKTTRDLEKSSKLLPNLDSARKSKNITGLKSNVGKSMTEDLMSAQDIYDLKAMIKKEDVKNTDFLRSKKTRNELITFNTINSQSNDTANVSEKHKYELNALRNLKKQCKMVSLDNELFAQEKESIQKDQVLNSLVKKSTGIKSQKDMKINCHQLSSENPEKKCVKKEQKQLLKNKKKVCSGNSNNMSNQQQNSKCVETELIEKEFLEYFANKQKIKIDQDKIDMPKSRSPELKNKKKTTDRRLILQNDVLEKKRSNSRKPSRIELDNAKKNIPMHNLNSISKNDKSQNSLSKNLKTQKTIDQPAKLRDQFLRHPNFVIKSNFEEKLIESTKNEEKKNSPQSYPEMVEVNSHSKLLEQLKKFRIKSSKDRMQVLLNAHKQIDPGNKSDMIPSRQQIKKNYQNGDVIFPDESNQNLKSILSLEAIQIKKTKPSRETLPFIDVGSKNQFKDNDFVSSSLNDRLKILSKNKKKEKSRVIDEYVKNEEEQNLVKITSSLKKSDLNNIKQSKVNSNQIKEKSIRISKREKINSDLEGIQNSHYYQKRASSAGIGLCKIKDELQIKKDRGLSTNFAAGGKRLLGKFVLKRKIESAKNVTKSQLTKQSINLPQNILQLGKIGDFAMKQHPLSAKLGSSDLIKSHLLRYKIKDAKV